ncbi:MAG: RNA polymerase factor sigma-54 [Polaribacter sp.]|jgi:RNA polymerase sigma-54 factor|nr:RNA polymerase factor sigma-54 [Polaribacter sp.]MDB0026647.1 RNA polymerase factor sigma-54 [Polaribacter sp.]MDB0040077.1 RNA polymerase factor sigma-54 [Polaribacter sp.]MDB4167224.1 RNA polymerase factor sigma-54 [Polaribacter sp.]MDB9887141.1 RNA polymerase factor sigma-54 [Polaribacter sp.]
MLKQSLHYKLLQKLSPQQIQLMKLIQLPTQAFEERIKQEIEENPALEIGKEEPESFEDTLENEYDDAGTESIDTEDINIDEYLSDDDIPSYKTQANNYSEDDEEKNVPYAAGITFHQSLKSQLDTFRFNEEERLIAEFLVGSIDDSGYIRRDILDLVDDLAFTANVFTTEEKVITILKTVIHTLDPIGVGARDLKECLIIQLKGKEKTKIRKLSIEILETAFDHFVKKHYRQLQERFTISEEELKAVTVEISKLNPKPGSSYVGNSKIAEQIVPDFSIKILDGELDLSLNSRNAPELHISREYNNMLKGYQEATSKSKSQKDAVFFIKQKLDAAKWFIDAIKQRQQTLLVTMNTIMHYQLDYFLSGDERKLKPMILKDIADQIQMDISTVSRVANSKYVSTPYGTKLIKEFFSESMKNDQGEEVSTKEIKKILETVISKEDKRKPLTDEKLALLLKEKGYPIARRTIAKYREQLELPVARLRKEI